MRWGPGAAELEFLRFVVPIPGLGLRYLLAGALFVTGLVFWMLGSPTVAVGLGVPLLLLGHLPLWVRGLSTSPGGATPAHEEIWAPVEEGWLDRITNLENRAREWDLSPWDITSGRGCLILLAGLAALAGASMAVGVWLGAQAAVRLMAAGALLAIPQWFNGMRTTWRPSELRLKGETLALAHQVAAEAAKELEPVPLLALREGKRGRYPVDARLMLRPAGEDGSGFLGVQVQVAINTVRGSDYPYLYCVILGKEGFRLPAANAHHRAGTRRLVLETGEGQGASYLVVRQHADKSGGWHTEPAHIREIVTEALALGLSAWNENRQPSGG